MTGAVPRATFASTGPEGHRGRMRARLLQLGPQGLADYEVLEMLLFLGIPRRDTGPLAKAGVNLFGSLSGALAAPPEALRRAGLDPAGGEGAVADVFALVRETARRLGEADARRRPVLSDMDCVLAHLDLPARLRQPPHLAALLLNNRNQLLAELRCPEEQEPDAVAQAVARRAVAVHATALVLATCRPGAAAAVTDRDAAVTGSIARALRVLAVTIHDHWVFGAGDAGVSLRRKGLL